MVTALVDVAIVGGGPAGCSAALSLRAHAPTLSVSVLESVGQDTPHVGESVPAAARRIFEHLGILDLLENDQHRPAYGTVALWGASVPVEHDFVTSARGHGWRLARGAFESALLARAAERGVVVRMPAHVETVSRLETGWRIDLSSGERLAARFIVDATGSKARIARACGAKRIVADGLFAAGRFFKEGAGRPDPRVFVEAFADGWWYTAGLPNGRRFAACMTDADVARRLGVATPDGWNACLESAPHVARLLDGAEPVDDIVVRPARSHHLAPATGDGWLAVGDAASTFDPLSSQGITKALRSGIFASYAIGDLLTKGDATGLARYERFVADGFAGYLRTRAQYYDIERRWSDTEFWRRRHTQPSLS